LSTHHPHDLYQGGDLVIRGDDDRELHRRPVFRERAVDVKAAVP
jgi:hypothetical protein